MVNAPSSDGVDVGDDGDTVPERPRMTRRLRVLTAAGIALVVALAAAGTWWALASRGGEPAAGGGSDPTRVPAAAADLLTVRAHAATGGPLVLDLQADDTLVAQAQLTGPDGGLVAARALEVEAGALSTTSIDVMPGQYLWRVTAPGARPVTGRITVKGVGADAPTAPVSPTPDATPAEPDPGAGDPPVAVAQPQPVPQPTSTPSSATTSTPPRTKAAQPTKPAAKANQSVSVFNNASTIKLPQAMSGTFTVTGGSGRRVASETIYGPFGSKVGCSGTVAARPPSKPFDLSQTIALTTWQPTKGGYYYRLVNVSDNETTKAASVCASPVTARSAVKVTQVPVSGIDTTIKLNRQFQLQINLYGVSFPQAGKTITATMYGPFKDKATAKTCPAKRAASSATGKAVTRHAKTTTAATQQYRLSGVTLIRKEWAGQYISWKTTYPGDTFNQPATSECGQVYKVVK